LEGATKIELPGYSGGELETGKEAHEAIAEHGTTEVETGTEAHEVATAHGETEIGRVDSWDQPDSIQPIPLGNFKDGAKI
jgi:hypothetical protein